MSLNTLRESLRNNKEIVLAAVLQNGGELQYASESLRNDKDVVLRAVFENEEALNYASESLQNDHLIISNIENNRSRFDLVPDIDDLI